MLVLQNRTSLTFFFIVAFGTQHFLCHLPATSKFRSVQIVPAPFSRRQARRIGTITVFSTLAIGIGPSKTATSFSNALGNGTLELPVIITTLAMFSTQTSL
jgi:hypothetical protein